MASRKVSLLPPLSNIFCLRTYILLIDRIYYWETLRSIRVQLGTITRVLTIDKMYPYNLQEFSTRAYRAKHAPSRFERDIYFSLAIIRRLQIKRHDILTDFYPCHWNHAKSHDREYNTYGILHRRYTRNYCNVKIADKRDAFIFVIDEAWAAIARNNQISFIADRCEIVHHTGVPVAPHH